MLTGYYEPPLVLISILVAIVASYSALSLAGRVTEATGHAMRAWIVGGAVALGSGIWAMHFVGMLAFRLPIPIAFDIPITLVSLVLPIAASGIALWQVSRANLGPVRLGASALVMGAGINAMHYTGMAAMRMMPGIDYHPGWFAASIVIAILAAGAALWIAFALTIIVLTTLHLVRIPLTAFAFLGGALALGVGFGTQTLIKNLISGLIVLGERKVRLGDIVEIDNVVGTVTSIDVRSCTVQAVDGTESLIPNSFLLENRVNNWTYSSRDVRRSIRVGVSYGSPARQVADLLEQCARRHGVVLDEPKPQVIFEDFGENAMVFTLYFWVPLKPDVSAMLVSSDLRFMIDKCFAEAGLQMAFPRRDLHLLADEAIPVRLAGHEGGS